MGAKQKTTKVFKEEMALLHPRLLVKSEYVDLMTPVVLYCKDCKFTFSNRPRNTITNRKAGCPKCAKVKELQTRNKSLNIRFLNKLNTKFNGRIKLVGKYIDAYTDTKFKCNNGHKYLHTPKFILGLIHGCPECARLEGNIKTRITNENIQKKIDKAIGRNKVKFIERKQDIVTGEFECLVCTQKWETTISSMFRIKRPNNGCPKCRIHNSSITGFKTKQYKLGRKNIKIQGYEDTALDLITKKILPSKIIAGNMNGVPIIYYNFNSKTLRYHPDIYIPHLNKIIEVKSVYTLGIIDKLMSKQSRQEQTNKYSQVKAKAVATINTGFNFKLMVFDENKKLVKLPGNWYKLTRKELMQTLKL